MIGIEMKYEKTSNHDVLLCHCAVISFHWLELAPQHYSLIILLLWLSTSLCIAHLRFYFYLRCFSLLFNSRLELHVVCHVQLVIHAYPPRSERRPSHQLDRNLCNWLCDAQCEDLCWALEQNCSLHLRPCLDPGWICVNYFKHVQAVLYWIVFIRNMLRQRIKATFASTMETATNIAQTWK